MIRAGFWTVLTALFLSGCRLSERDDMDLSGFENPVTAAVVERLVADAKAAFPDDTSPPFALVIGERLAPSSRSFLEPFRDQGIEFIDWDNLDYDRVTKATVIKGTRTNPIVLQLVQIAQTTPTEHVVSTAWNRGAQVEHARYRVLGSPADGASLQVERLEEADAPEKEDVSSTAS